MTLEPTIQYHFAWWYQRKKIFYPVLLLIGAADIFIALNKLPAIIISPLLFILALYLGTIAYAFALVYHRMGIAARSSKSPDYDRTPDGWLFNVVIMILYPINYAIYLFFNFINSNSIFVGVVTLLVNVAVATVTYSPMMKLIEPEYGPTKKRYTIGIFIWIVMVLSLLVFVQYPAQNQLVQILYKKGWIK